MLRKGGLTECDLRGERSHRRLTIDRENIHDLKPLGIRQGRQKPGALIIVQFIYSHRDCQSENMRCLTPFGAL